MCCNCNSGNMAISVTLDNGSIKNSCNTLKEIPKILNVIAKESEVDLSDCKIELLVDGCSIGEIGVVFHNDLETLEKSLSEYMFVVVGKNLLKRIV